jgi:hypothetical protein
LPCEWNVQLHARLNSIILCQNKANNDNNNNNNNSTNKSNTNTNKYSSISDIPYNCNNSRSNNIFVCTKQAGVIHFMAQSYRNYNFLSYYEHFWDLYDKLSWYIINSR